MSDKAGPIKGN